MKSKRLRFRQIHLDFHTSPDIEKIGAAFDKKTWQDTLKKARVNSITCFSKCHHGLTYHPTKVGVPHPHLKFDLFRAQLEACNEIDVKVPIYISAGVDVEAAKAHPEWREINKDGRYTGWVVSPLDAGFPKLCFNTPYVDYLCEQIKEAVTMFPQGDGVFLDIIYQSECCCKWCMDVMEKNHLNPEVEEDRIKCSEIALNRYFTMTTAACKVNDSSMPVFHNSGHITRNKREVVQFNSHLELESLPTGGWGYDHFPESATYASHLDRDYLGMTGKFHTSWGEFGGFKHPNALRYECAAMQAFGAKCSIGDQLHPSGKIDASTYDLIGAAYAEVETKEPWCDEVTRVADIAILSSESEYGRKAEYSDVDTGACRILLEGHHLFSLTHREDDFRAYKLVILPDNIEIDDALKAKLDAYMKDGGKLLLTGRSGLKKGSDEFAFDMGAAHSGESPYEPDYILPAEKFRADFVQTPLVMYFRSQRIKVTKGESLGQIFDPYFNRTYKHFCSHRHTPNQPEASGFDCGVKLGNIAYLAHPMFMTYRIYGAVAYKDYVLKVIDDLLDESKTVTTNLPSTARITLQRQVEKNRRVLHLLYANKILRGGQVTLQGGGPVGNTIEVIEDLDELRNIQLTVNDSDKVKRATLEPQGVEIPFTRHGKKIVLKVDSFTCHQMVVLQE